MVSPISNASGRVAMPPPALKPEDAFKKIDSTNKGFITESDLASAIVQISPEGVSLSQADAQALAKDAFSRMDANADGKVSSTEFKDAAPKNGPPGGGSGGPAGAKSASAPSASHSFDPADTNQDGTVSELERLAYASTSQAANASDSSATKPQ